MDDIPNVRRCNMSIVRRSWYSQTLEFDVRLALLGVGVRHSLGVQCLTCLQASVFGGVGDGWLTLVRLGRRHCPNLEFSDRWTLSEIPQIDRRDRRNFAVLLYLTFVVRRSHNSRPSRPSRPL
jgi:hypothetical protein